MIKVLENYLSEATRQKQHGSSKVRATGLFYVRRLGNNILIIGLAAVRKIYN